MIMKNLYKAATDTIPTVIQCVHDFLLQAGKLSRTLRGFACWGFLCFAIE
jgi:hypothetical protein